MPSLPIQFEERRIGELKHDRGRLELAYETGARGVGRRLPARSEPYSDAECRAWVANSLPEGDWREVLSKRLGLPSNDDFGLLRWLGHDCAGAVTFQDAALEHEQAGDAYTPLAEAELRHWLKDPLNRPTPNAAPGLRRALAGAQDKLILHLAEGQPYLCERGAPSTVIIKPDIAGGAGQIELSALNELLCMQLAAKVGLRVPRTYWFAGAYVVERFDRVFRGSRLERLHQEDFAQLLGLPPAKKYTITLSDCFELLDRELPEPEPARRELLERVLFNLLIGNADAHGKNFALLFRGDAAELAPAYDLLCTQIYPGLSDSFAMRVGPARREDELSAQAWLELAEVARLPLEWLKRRGAELSGALQLALRELPSQILKENPSIAGDIYPARRRDDFLKKLADAMVGNCKRIGRSLQARL